jgi:hypothetical protein
MSIGAGIFLIMAGAILAFGIRDRGGAVDLTAVGLIIMAAGAAGIWLSYYITRQRQQVVESPAIPPDVEEEYRDLSNEPVYPDTAQQPPVHESRLLEDTDNAAEEGTVRHVDLDPAASGLHTPIPHRTRREIQVPSSSAPGWLSRFSNHLRRHR